MNTPNEPLEVPRRVTLPTRHDGSARREPTDESSERGAL